MDESEVILAIQDKLIFSDQKTVARDLGVSASYLNDILHKRRKVSDRIGFLLGFEKVWRKI